MLTARQAVEPGIQPYFLIKVWPNKWAKVDPDDYAKLKRYHWRVVKSNACEYAVRKYTRHGKTFYVRMHREIMNTPKGMECHHVHGDTFDNRKSELENLTPWEHKNRGPIHLVT